MSKSDGHYKYPSMNLIDTNLHKGEITVEFRSGERHFRLTTGYYYMAKRFVEVAREITFKYRVYAKNQWDAYRSLKKITGYQSPDGKE